MKNKQLALPSLALLAIMIGGMAGCKTRQVSIKTTDSTTVTKTSVHTDSTVVRHDSTDNHTKTLSVSSDSGLVTTVITPDSGAVISFNGATGLFTGKVKSITTTEKFRTAKTTTTNTTDKTNSSDSTRLLQQTTGSDSTHVQKKDKEAKSAPGYTWMLYAAGIAAILGGAVWLFFKIKGKVLPV